MADEQQNHGGWEGTRYGSHTPAFIRSNFFVFLMGQLVTIIGAAVYFGGLVTQVSDLQKWRGETKATIERMDSQGTNASRWNLGQERRDIESNTARISDLEKGIRKIDVMDATLARIDKKMDELSQRK